MSNVRPTNPDRLAKSEDPLNHPTAEELRALSLGQLADAELARVSAHLGECPECCRRIDLLASDDPLWRGSSRAPTAGKKCWSPRPSVARPFALYATVQRPALLRGNESQIPSR